MSNSNNLPQSEQSSSNTSEPIVNPTQNETSANEVISQTEQQESESVNLTAEQLNDMLHNAYLRGRNENIEARIDTDSQAKPQRSVAGELLIKGLTGVAKAIFNPGRRSIWPPRRG